MLTSKDLTGLNASTSGQVVKINGESFLLVKIPVEDGTYTDTNWNRYELVSVRIDKLEGMLARTPLEKALAAI